MKQVLPTNRNSKTMPKLEPETTDPTENHDSWSIKRDLILELFSSCYKHQTRPYPSSKYDNNSSSILFSRTAAQKRIKTLANSRIGTKKTTWTETKTSFNEETINKTWCAYGLHKANSRLCKNTTNSPPRKRKERGIERGGEREREHPTHNHGHHQAKPYLGRGHTSLLTRTA